MICETLRAVLPLPRGEDRHLHLARRAPRGPEVEQNDFAAEMRESERLAAEVREREAGRFFVEQIVRRRSGARCGGRKRHADEHGEKHAAKEARQGERRAARATAQSQPETPCLPNRRRGYRPGRALSRE